MNHGFWKICEMFIRQYILYGDFNALSQISNDIDLYYQKLIEVRGSFPNFISWDFK